MILVLLLSIIILLILSIISSTLKIEIKNLRFSNFEKNNITYKLKLTIYTFYKFKLFSVKLNNKKIKNILNRLHLKKIDLTKIKKDFQISDIKEISKIKPRILYLDLDLRLGVENVVLTSYIVGIVSTIIATILPYITTTSQIKNINYKILPIYNKNAYNIKLNNVVQLKTIDILIAVYNIAKLRKKNERKIKKLQSV